MYKWAGNKCKLLPEVNLSLSILNENKLGRLINSKKK